MFVSSSKFSKSMREPHCAYKNASTHKYINGNVTLAPLLNEVINSFFFYFITRLFFQPFESVHFSHSLSLSALISVCQAAFALLIETESIFGWNSNTSIVHISNFNRPESRGVRSPLNYNTWNSNENKPSRSNGMFRNWNSNPFNNKKKNDQIKAKEIWICSLTPFHTWKPIFSSVKISISIAFHCKYAWRAHSSRLPASGMASLMILYQ